MFRSLTLSLCALAAALVFGATALGIPGVVQGTLLAQGPGKLIDPPVKPVSKWGAKFNPSGKIYKNGFRAFYFDRTTGAAPFEEYSRGIGVKYAWAELHAINSPNFAGYWVGRLHFDAPTTQVIAVSLSWSKARIFIDGRLVHDGSSKTEFSHAFGAGDHLIEVEFINNWHTTEFKVTVQPPMPRRSPGEISALLSLRDYARAELYYVGVYESDRQDSSIDVVLPDTGRPAILWLDSYEAIDWRLTAPSGVAAVIVASYTPGSQVKGPGDMQLMRAAKAFGVHTLQGGGRGCHCTAGLFHCENANDIGRVAGELRGITGRTLAGAAASYSGATMTIEPWTAASAGENDLARARTEEARRQCAAKADPDFDNMVN